MEDDDFSHLDEIHGSCTGSDRPATLQQRTSRHRVVLLEEAPKLDVEAVLDRVMPEVLQGLVARINVALAETMPAAGFRYVAQGRQIACECEVPNVLDLFPDSITEELNCRFASLAPAAEFQGPYFGSLNLGLQQYATELVDAYTECERKRILARHVEARRQGPLNRLKDDDRKSVEATMGELPVLGPCDIDEVDELWAKVHADAPWLQAASVEAWRAMRHEVSEGRGAWCPPLLLTGARGTGKTTLGRSLAAALGVPLVEIDAGNGTAAFQIAGLEKGWNGAEPGLLIETILRDRISNPVVVINEICRAGSGMTSTKGGQTSLSDALLALLDRGSCRRWRCPALRVEFDLSRVIWVLTANRTDTIDTALLSRVRVVDVPKPTAAHIATIVRGKLFDIDKDLADHAAVMITTAWSRRSITLRQVDAMCERVRRSLTGPRLH